MTITARCYYHFTLNVFPKNISGMVVLLHSPQRLGEHYITVYYMSTKTDRFY